MKMVDTHYFSIETLENGVFYTEGTYENINEAIKNCSAEQKLDLHLCKHDEDGEAIFSDGQSDYLIVQLLPEVKVIYRRNDGGH